MEAAVSSHLVACFALLVRGLQENGTPDFWSPQNARQGETRSAISTKCILRRANLAAHES